MSNEQGGKPPGGWPAQPNWPQQPSPPSHGPPQMPAPQPGWHPGAHYAPTMPPPPQAPPPMNALHGMRPPDGGWPQAGVAPQANAAQPPAEAGMFKRALGRAFRLRIEPHEVSPKERAALLAANPPIAVPYLQAFLAWRRSVLFFVAVALIPLTLLRLAEAFSEDMPEQLRFLGIVPAAAEGFLCLVCWYQLRNWTHWRQQRRALMKAWIVFMAAPFLVFLIPVDSVLANMVTAPASAVAGDQWGDHAGQLAVESAAAATAIVVMKVVIAVQALLTLAPKAVSLVAGSVRAGIVTKMLFPGTSGPGWIVVLSTPIYALFVFTLLIVPYQLTGSGWFMGAMVALGVAQLAIGRAGYGLARPMTHDEAVKAVTKARGVYVIAMISFAACILVAMGPIAEKLGAGTVISTALSFETNTMLLTLIASDLVITGLARSAGLSTGTGHLVDDSNRQLSAFVG